jgi:hypothetical protein
MQAPAATSIAACGLSQALSQAPGEHMAPRQPGTHT